MSWFSRPLFISSTFKDMQAERDHLRDVVFPELARRLAERRCHLEPIDLRWGVETVETPEQETKELLVLKVCLDEIERCRPFLLVILGDRYGWVPPEGRMQAAVDGKGYKTGVKDKSVTALEIEYGVLDSPEQKKRSFFYFRDVANYPDMPENLRPTYSDEYRSEEGAKAAHGRLQDLKKRIETDATIKARVRHYPVTWENGRLTGIEAWGKQVLEDLWAEFEDETKERAASQDPSWQGEERRALEEFVENRSRGFVGREKLLQELMDFALSPPGGDWGLCLHGGPGSGKSGLFAALYRKLEAEQEQGRGLLLAHAAGISLCSGGVDAMLRRWIQDLARHLKLKDDDPSKELKTFEEKKKLFAEILSRTCVNTRVVCCIDALNQFERSAIARHLTWLPELWPKNARLIATAIAGDETAALGKKNGVKLQELPVLGATEAQAIIGSICGRFHKTLNPAVVKELIEKKTANGALACANPLWLTMAVTQLNLLDEDDFAEAEKLQGTPEQKLHAFMLKTVEEFPTAVEELYSTLFDRAHNRFGKRYGIDWIPHLLSILASSRYGLRESDCAAIIRGIMAHQAGRENDKDFAEDFMRQFALQFAAVRRYLSAHLVQRGEMGLWDFTHAQGRMAVKGLEGLKIEEKEYHRLIAEYLEGLKRGDALRVQEIMWHYFLGGLIKNASTFYGGNLPEDRFDGATHILAELIVNKENGKPNIGIDWIEQMLNNSVEFDITYMICHRVQQKLYRIIKSITDLKTSLCLVSLCKSFLSKLSINAPENRLLLYELSMSLEILGDIAQASGDCALARGLFSDCLETRNKLPKNEERDRLQSICFERLGSLALLDNNIPLAIQHYNQFAESALSSYLLNPNNTRAFRDLAVSYERTGLLFIKMGKFSLATKLFEDLMRIAETLCKNDSDNYANIHLLISSYDKLGGSLVQDGKISEATECFQTCLCFLDKLHANDPSHTEIAWELSTINVSLGDLYFDQAIFDTAREYFIKATELLTKIFQCDLNNALWDRDLAVVHGKIGRLYLKEGELILAGEYFEKSIHAINGLCQKSKLNSEYLVNLSTCYTNLGELAFENNNLPEAFNYYTKASEKLQVLYTDSPTNAEIAHNLACTYDWLGDISSRLREPNENYNRKLIKIRDNLFQKSFQIREDLLKQDPQNVEHMRDLTISLEWMGLLSIELKDWSLAKESFLRYKDIAETIYEKRPHNIKYEQDLFRCYQQMQKLNDRMK